MKRDWINDPKRVFTYQKRVIDRLGKNALLEEFDDMQGFGGAEDVADHWYRDGLFFMAKLAGIEA